MKNNSIKTMSLLFGCTLSIASYAATGWHFLPNFLRPGTEANKTVLMKMNSGFYLRFPGPFVDDITSGQAAKGMKLTKVEQHQAKVWGLTSGEEARYVLLMQNKSGTYYHNASLTPVQVLGINAKTNQARHYYAALAAKQRAQRIAKELAFNAASNQAYSKLMAQYHLPAVRKFDFSRFSPYSYKPIVIQPNDQYLLFVHINDSVRTIVGYFLEALTTHYSVHLNIYFVGKDITQKSIASWAAGQSIPQEMVANKTITLNFGNERYQSLPNHTKTPSLYRVRDGKTTSINIGRF